MKKIKEWLHSLFSPSKAAKGENYSNFVKSYPYATVQDFAATFGGGSPSPKYLFIINSPHSGGRLFYNILDSSPQVCTFINRGGGTTGSCLLTLHNQHPRRGNLPEYQTRGNDLTYQPPWHVIRGVYHSFWDNSPVLCDRAGHYLWRAKEVENYFSNYGEVFFIIQIRNPYNCESLEVKEWVKNAEMLRWYAQHLHNKIVLRYEDLVMNPQGVKEALVDFLPELHSINMGTDQSVRLAQCNRKKSLKSLTDQFLEVKDKDIKNKVLSQHLDLLEFFGYDYIE